MYPDQWFYIDYEQSLFFLLSSSSRAMVGARRRSRCLFQGSTSSGGKIGTALSLVLYDRGRWYKWYLTSIPAISLSRNSPARSALKPWFSSLECLITYRVVKDMIRAATNRTPSSRCSKKFINFPTKQTFSTSKQDSQTIVEQSLKVWITTSTLLIIQFNNTIILY